MRKDPRKTDIRTEINKALKGMEAYGESKAEARRDGTAAAKIFSYDTMRNYKEECHRAAAYVAARSPDGFHVSLEAAKPLMVEYVQQRAERAKEGNLSSWTVKKQGSALAKLYQDSKSFQTPDLKRERANITRSRNNTVVSEKTGREIKNPTTRHGHFSEKNHRDLVELASATGLRPKELRTLRGDHLKKDADGRGYHLELRPKEPNGCQTKNGRDRDVPVVCDEATLQKIVALCEAKGGGLVAEVPSHMPVHNYRAVYAQRLYSIAAAPPIPARPGKPGPVGAAPLVAKTPSPPPRGVMARQAGGAVGAPLAGASAGGGIASAAASVPAAASESRGEYVCRKDMKGMVYDKEVLRIVTEALGHSRLGVVVANYFYDK